MLYNVITNGFVACINNTNAQETLSSSLTVLLVNLFLWLLSLNCVPLKVNLFWN